MAGAYCFSQLSTSRAKVTSQPRRRTHGYHGYQVHDHEQKATTDPYKAQFDEGHVVGTSDEDQVAGWQSHKSITH